MRSRLCDFPEIACLRVVRKIVLFFALGTITAAAPILLITPGRSLDFGHGKTGTALSVDTPDAAEIRFSASTLTFATDHASETFDLGAKPCEEVMWSSLKGKCLSIAKRRKHPRGANGSAVSELKRVQSE
jgi:hypothetical protein